MVKRGLSSKEETQTSKKKDLLKVCARCEQGVCKVCARCAQEVRKALHASKTTYCRRIRDLFLMGKRYIVEGKETY